jgi:hypothetical protein
MGGRNGFAAGGNHLIERAALGELRVEFPAEFTRPAGACVETMDDSWIDVFHERRSWEGRKRIRPICEAESQYSASADLLAVWTTPLYYKGWDLYKPFMAGANFLLPGWLKCTESAETACATGYDVGQ